MMLRRLNLLIHGLCYAEQVHHGHADPTGGAAPYIRREAQCIERWQARITAMAPDESLAILTWRHGPRGPAADFEAFATEALGDRCLILSCPEPHEPAFVSVDAPAFHEAVTRFLNDMWAGQSNAWNKEELSTGLHTVRCGHELMTLCQQRGLSFDPHTIDIEAWGASFEGCVLKYSLYMRHVLDVAKPIQMPYGMIVPDARFMTDVPDGVEEHLSDDVRLFHFRSEHVRGVLFAMLRQPPGTPAMRIRVPIDSARVTVRDKRGDTLWPGDGTFAMPDVPEGLREPELRIVRGDSESIDVPVAGGMAYRIAKRGYYLLADSDDDFDSLLAAARQATISAANT